MPPSPVDGVTSSVIPYYLKEGSAFVLLGQRGAKSKAFANSWSLIGGFLDPGTESLEECAVREFHEETGIEAALDCVKLVAVQSNPHRDPRGVIVDTVWAVEFDSELPAVAADDLQAVAWHPLEKALTMTLAFDHHDSLSKFAVSKNLSTN